MNPNFIPIKSEKENLEAEKKTFEVKFNEVSVKLRHKDHQYKSMLKSKKTGCKKTDIMQNAIGKLSTGAETIKEEPIEIVVVKVTDRLIFQLQA